MRRRDILLLLVTLETSILFLLGSLGSSLSSYLDLSPSVILVIAALCILFVSILSVERQEPSKELEPSVSNRQQRTRQLVPPSMLGALPLGMCLGLLLTIPSVVLFPGALHFYTPTPIAVKGFSESELDFWLQRYELVSSTVFIGIAFVSAIFIGSHRAAALVAGWVVGASVSVCLLRPQENLIWYTFAGYAIFGLVLGWTLIRLRVQILRLRVALQASRD